MANIWSQIWNGLLSGLNYILQAFYHLGGYGVAIIMLTVVVKLILLPLTWKQTRSMLALQRLQPEMKKLQEKYKDDKEKLGQEMMKFYKENKVNPLSGCLPLLLQMPIFIALYEVLRKYVITPPIMLVGNAFASGTAISKIVSTNTTYFFSKTGFLWVKNLSDSTISADPYWILIILMALTTWYSQKQVTTDPRQQKIMLIMPFMMAFIAIRLPAGVVLYWIVTNVLQIAQQWAISKVDRKKALAEEAAGKAPPAKAPPAGKASMVSKVRKAIAGKTAAAIPAKGGQQGGQKGGEKAPAKTQAKTPGGAAAQAGAKGKSKSGAMVKPGTPGGKPKPQGTGPSDVRKPKPKPAGPTQAKKPQSTSRPGKPGGSKKKKKKGKGR